MDCKLIRIFCVCNFCNLKLHVQRNDFVFNVLRCYSLSTAKPTLLQLNLPLLFGIGLMNQHDIYVNDIVFCKYKCFVASV